MTKRQSKMLIFMCWALYVAAYIGRYSYNANKLPMSIAYGVDSDTEMGLISSFFFFAYGAGQIVNGLLCKYYNLKYVLPFSVTASAIINFIIFLGIAPFWSLKFLWLLNGVVQSVLWSSLLLALSRSLDEHYIKKAIIAMSTTASIGTLLAYGISALLALINGFKYTFLIAAIVMLAVAAVWLFIYDKMTDGSAKNVTAPESGDIPVKKKTDKSVFKILVIFGVFAIVINFIKDGLTTWVPEILFDTYSLPESLSILLTLVLPILTVFGTTFVVFLNKRIKDYVALILVLFGLASILVGVVVALLSTPHWGITLVAFGLIALLMGGSNNVVTSILPLSVRDKANSGFVGGMLNGCCYVGSTLSSVGLGALSDHYGEWLPVFYFLLGASVFVVVASGLILAVKNIKNKKNKNQ
ncbi:MAG: MFS transporter [Clostridia bacterium]|nr:MFS transporter [Clostridia bacterium]